VAKRSAAVFHSQTKTKNKCHEYNDLAKFDGGTIHSKDYLEISGIVASFRAAPNANHVDRPDYYRGISRVAVTKPFRLIAHPQAR
jgi:hypothetical protein